MLTVPNALSVLRLVLVPVFLYLLLVAHAYGVGGGRADVQRLLRLGGRQDRPARRQPVVAARGICCDPAVDRIYMVTVPVALAVHGIVPWWIVILIGRDALLASTLPVLRSHGLTALPVTYIGKGATFVLMSAFPLILLGSGRAVEPRHLACGWAFLIWGMALYLWPGVLYLIQVAMVARRMRRPSNG